MDPKQFSLMDIVHRKSPPKPWEEGDNIPWHEPSFSSRMLKEHLSQQHDAASRRSIIIDQQLDLIHSQILSQSPSNVLDLGCGPGLYTSRLAAIGHRCTGIDYSPASIAYAQKFATEQKLNCTYILADLREIQFGTGFDLVMLIFGEINVFPPDIARHILEKAYGSLNPGGVLLLEPHKFSTIENMGRQTSTWYSSESGLFSPNPHLVFSECFWNALGNNATVRYYIQVINPNRIYRYAQTFQAYINEEYQDLLFALGFEQIIELPSLEAKPSNTQDDFFGIIARKPN